MKKILLFAALIMVGGGAFAQYAMQVSNMLGYSIEVKNPLGENPGGVCSAISGSFTTGAGGPTLSIPAGNTWSGSVGATYINWGTGAAPGIIPTSIDVKIDVFGCPTTFTSVPSISCGTTGEATIYCSGLGGGTTFYIFWPYGPTGIDIQVRTYP